MPTDERPPAPGDLSGWVPDADLPLEEARDVLAAGELQIEGRLPWSSNLTFLVTVDGGPVTAVYKPARGERPLWDFPGGLHRREVAAFALSEALGWDLVPPTVNREDGPFGEGSLQLFVEADYEQHYFTLLEDDANGAALVALGCFDVVANNADRKSGHVLRGVDGRIWGIDHGLCFHPSPKLRTVIWDFAGDPVPGNLLDDLERLSRDLPDTVAASLTRREQAALVDRVRTLVGIGVFPAPEGDHPPYPWPLV